MDCFQRTWLALHDRLGSLASVFASFWAMSRQNAWLLSGSSLEHFMCSTLVDVRVVVVPVLGLQNWGQEERTLATVETVAALLTNAS